MEPSKNWNVCNCLIRGFIGLNCNQGRTADISWFKSPVICGERRGAASTLPSGGYYEPPVSVIIVDRHPPPSDTTNQYYLQLSKLTLTLSGHHNPRASHGSDSSDSREKTQHLDPSDLQIMMMYCTGLRSGNRIPNY